MAHAIIGFHAIEELVKSGKAKGRLEYSDKGPRVKRILALAAESGVASAPKPREELEKAHPGCRGIVFLSDADPRPESIDLDSWIAELDQVDDSGPIANGRGQMVIVLDHLSDPHNLGAILRSADQFGAALVISPEARSVKETSVVLSSSAGAAAWVPQCHVPNLARALEKLKDNGFWVYAADMGGDPLWKAKLSGRVAFVLGAEGGGVSRLLGSLCDAKLSIPSAGKVDSLNVSVAAGVFMYEVARQRG